MLFTRVEKSEFHEKYQRDSFLRVGSHLHTVTYVLLLGRSHLCDEEEKTFDQ